MQAHAWTQHVSEVLKALSKGKSKDICICNVTLIQFSLEIKIKESVKVYPDRIVFAEDPLLNALTGYQFLVSSNKRPVAHFFCQRWWGVF